MMGNRRTAHETGYPTRLRYTNSLEPPSPPRTAATAVAPGPTSRVAIGSSEASVLRPPRQKYGRSSRRLPVTGTTSPTACFRTIAPDPAPPRSRQATPIGLRPRLQPGALFCRLLGTSLIQRKSTADARTRSRHYLFTDHCRAVCPLPGGSAHRRRCRTAPLGVAGAHERVARVHGEESVAPRRSRTGDPRWR
jgi:hypothetical protein